MPTAPGRSEVARIYRRWYGTARWRRLRLAQLQLEPLCRKCSEAGLIRAATVVDHVRPHRGNAVLFWDPDNLASLCNPHHDATKQREEAGHPSVRVGVDGWPA
jgi:5-methylcytosine-specific restriction enzyme A